MARKSAAAVTPEPPSLPEVLTSPSKTPESQRDAYWLSLLQNPDDLKAAIAAEDFFTMLQELPDAFWDRLSIYLYRRPDDEGRMVKNAPNQRGKYLPGGVLHQSIDEEFVAKKWGGGKYTAYLKLDSKEMIREHTFSIDGPPKVLEGQTLEFAGKPNGSVQPNPGQPSETALDKVIDANSRANESSMEIVTSASKAAIAMVQDQAKNAAVPAKDPLDLALRLVEAFRSSAPAGNSMTDALTLIDKLDAMNARRNPPQPEKQETKLEEVGAIVETLTGKSLSDLTRGKNPAADPIASWVPIAQTAGQVALSFFEKLPHLMHERTEQLRLELQIRQTGGTAPPPPGTPARLAAPVVIPPAPQPPAPPSAMDPQALVQSVIKLICDGFDRDRNEGSEIAAALDVQFGEQLAMLGIDRMLGSRTEVAKFIEGIPELKQRSQHPRWTEFFEDFMAFTEHAYGEEEPEPGGPQPVEAEKPPAA
jgi:hypothetical protein